jgi:predicted RNase H-like HicB family nuclease
VCPGRFCGVRHVSDCAADGKTYKEALANVEIIIQEWIETAKELGRPIPAPRGRLARTGHVENVLSAPAAPKDGYIEERESTL